MRNNLRFFQLRRQGFQGVGIGESLQIREYVKYPIVLHLEIIPN